MTDPVKPEDKMADAHVPGVFEGKVVTLTEVFNAIERLQAEGLEWTAPAIKAASGYDLLPVQHICGAGKDGVYLQTIFTLANPATKEGAQIFFQQSGENIGASGHAHLKKVQLGSPATVTASMPLEDYLPPKKPKP